VIFLAYTSSQQWRGPKPPGIYVFDQGTAAGLGQSKPFFLDLRRMALLPATVDWFPELDSPGHGTVGRAPEKLRLELEATALDIARRRPEIMERLGPLGTGRRR
jgi:hypothetical protein